MAACAWLASCFHASPAVSAADEVHWTITGQTSVTLNWRGCDTFVRYGLTPAYGSIVGGETPDPVPHSNPGPFWQARITGLRENTLYHYAIGNGPGHTFRTPPRRGSSGFTVFAAGDVGDSSSYLQMGPLQDLIASHAPDFVLMVGDLTYGNDNGQKVVGRHFNDVMRWSQDAAYMPAWGNHEWDAAPDDDLRNYKGRFDLPNPQTSPGVPPESCCGEDWSWFDYGNVRFIGIPEPYSPGLTWADWYPRAQTLMAEAQLDPAITFIVTFGHRPAYSSGNHAGSPLLKGYLDQLGLSFSKYVLDLCGHSHNYERTHPQSGVVHITAGMGGGHLHALSGNCKWEGGCPPPSWTAFRALRHGALKLRFSEGAIEGTLFCGPPESGANDIECTPGDVIDSFTIGSPTPSATYFVDGSNLACSDAGPGTEAQPYCTIGAAVAAQGAPGVKIQVRPGVYPEQVTVPVSGAAGSPLVLSADPGVILEEARDLSRPEDWMAVAGDVWLATSVTTSPKQVVMDGSRQSVGAAPATALQPGEYLWVTGEGLYLNAGGGNPGLHPVFVGARNHGFLFNGISHVVVEGFEIRHADDRAIRSEAGSNLTMRDNTIRNAGSYGIQISQGSQHMIEDNVFLDCGNHAINLISGVTGSTISGNECSGSARPTGSGANGINLFGSPGNRVIGNRVHHNQDSGIQIQNGSNDCLVALNRSWNNGDHGFDQQSATGVEHLGNVASRNQRSGFIVQGTSTGSRITNCIAIDNGTTSGQFNLYVDAGSVAGFSSNANLFWNSNGAPGIRFGDLVGVTLAQYQAATGHDAGSLETDPLFVNAATGDFRLEAGSPAIDSGDSAPIGWTALDAEGYGRYDAVGVWDTGTGPVAYSDRGALEHRPDLPSPALTLTPPTGVAPLMVTLDAAGSTSTAGSLTYEFDCGDGLLLGAQPFPDFAHVYQAGTWISTLWVQDEAGGRARISAPVIVAPPLVQNLATNPSFETNTSGWNSFSGGVLARVPGGFHGGWALQVSPVAGDLTFGINDSPNVVPSTVAGVHYRIGAWVSSSRGTGQVTMRVQEFQNGTAVAPRQETAPVTLSCMWQPVTMEFVAQSSGSNLDIQILDLAGTAGESFLVDHVTAHEVGPVTGVQDSLAWRPMAPVLAPNPVQGAAWLRFATSKRGPLRVEIFDVAGRRVRTVVDEPSLAAGEHAVMIGSENPSGSRLGSGLYFYRLQSVDGAVTRRFMLLR